MSKRLLFFSLRNFETDAGETVRIYGILNSLAAEQAEVVFISNAKKYAMFHPSIKHVFIGADFDDKSRMQGLLALFPWTVAYKAYHDLFKKIQLALVKADVADQPVFFFDYLDNSIGYVLKKKGFIRKYINDIHGIATLEFQSHVENSVTVSERIVNRLKHALVKKLDRKVFEFADGLIFGSENMRRFYQSEYDLHLKKSYVIPYVLSEDAVNRTVDENLKLRLTREYQLEDDFIFLFVGGYKPTAGVDDLIVAFDRLYKQYKNVKLILIGGGPLKESCVKLAEGVQSRSNIIFIHQIPYSELLTYQSLAHVIVCPDKNNTFSQYVIHLKYFDALISGKVVINGAFQSVSELNANDSLSLSFQPSNVDDLYEKLKLCREDYTALDKKYSETRSFTSKNLTYRSFIRQILDSPLA